MRSKTESVAMGEWVAGLSIVDGPLFVGSYLVTVLGCILLLIPGAGVRIRSRSFVRVAAIAAIGGALVGALATWLLSDVLNVFGVSLTWVVRWADTLAFAAFALVIVAVVTSRWWRVVLALVVGVLTAWCLFLTINVDFGQYPTVGDALGLTYQNEIDLPEKADTAPAIADWRPPADMPAQGTSGIVDIPAVDADFEPRRAAIYLPPAALTADPPALPVVIALSGQPGTPSDVFSAGGLAAVMDDLAAEHRGLAPIVIVPDQLGDPSTNPMCVDGPLGDSATYLTRDVPRWIRDNLTVSDDREAWTVAGFSQGGTCSIQLGAEYPELFGSIIDISGEVAPTLGSREKSIDEGFGGVAADYDAAVPEALLTAGAPYPDSVAVFVVGEEDAQYSAYMQTVSAVAETAGMTVVRALSPSTGHDWNTARFGFSFGSAELIERWGIAG